MPWWFVPWWLVCPCGWCAWWWLPACPGACALMVGVSLCTLAVRVGCKWLPARLGASCLGGGYLHALVVRALLVGWWLVGWWLVVTYMPFSLCLGWCAWWWLPARLGGSCLGGW